MISSAMGTLVTKLQHRQIHRCSIICTLNTPNVTTNFSQSPPQLSNQYNTDWFLRTWLKSKLPEEVLAVIEPDLTRFGYDAANSIYDLHIQCEKEQPTLQQYDGWGKRIDHIHTSSAWRAQKLISAKEGLVAIGYERAYHEYSRVYQMAKLYLYHPSSGLYGCPLAMTDGAAKSIEALGLPEHLHIAFSRLTTRDPDRFWTSGQWMTERGGGSDVVNGTETVAYPQQDGSYALYGYKWFSSATDSDMALALAKVVDQDESANSSSPLAMFYIENRKTDGTLNNMQIVKLKNKLGTRQLPTAELLLSGTKAHLVGQIGKGVATISHMLSISRIYNCLFASSSTRRMVELCKDYSMRRRAFGLPIYQYPLHTRTLADMELRAQSAALLGFELSRLLGLVECERLTDTNLLLLRLLTPVSKLYTAKVAVSVMSEGLECIGGQGYIEDTGFPSMLRDAQVLPIWEGTTNICSLDVLRAIKKTNGEVVSALVSHGHSILRRCDDCSSVRKLRVSLDKLKIYMESDFLKNSDSTVWARELAYSFANLYIGILFAELRYACPDDPSLQISLSRWCNQELLPILTAYNKESDCNTTSWEDLQMIGMRQGGNHTIRK